MPLSASWGSLRSLREVGTVSAGGNKGGCADMTEADKALHERGMKICTSPPREDLRKVQGPSALRRPPSAFVLFCAEHRPQIKGGHPGLSTGDAAKKLGAMWTKAAADDRQPCEKTAAKLKEKYKKHTAAYQAKRRTQCSENGVVKAGKNKKKKRKKMMNELTPVQLFFLVCKAFNSWIHGVRFFFFV